MESKTLRPRASAKQDIDVIILVDGSESVIGADFNREKQLCLELAARLGGNSQLGVIQFGAKAQIITPLTTNREELEKKVDAMTKVSGGANLSVAFEICYSEFNRSKIPNNQRQVWIFTNGSFKQDPRNATLTEKLIREKQVTVIAIGIGHRIDMRLLNRLAAPGCCFLVGDFTKALKLFQYNPNKERNCQIAGNIVFPKSVPAKLGESIILRVEVENVGLKDIAQGARVIFRENSYFREETVVLFETLHVGDQTSFYVKLTSKVYDTPIDSQLSLLPELLEFTMVDAANNDVTCDCTGFFFNLEDFTGDVFTYKPQQDLELVNIMTFGAPGAGKSLFINSICSSLSDHIHNLAIVASPKKATGKPMQKFQLNVIPGFEQAPISLYDMPGVEEESFPEEELAQYLDGLVDNTRVVIHERKGGKFVSPHEALAQKMHVIAFFVTPTLDDATTERLLAFYTKIKDDKKCRVVIVISHSDTVMEADQRTELHKNICKKFSAEPSNVFFLENYVDVKDKQFNVDRNVLRVLLALLSQAEEFILSQRPAGGEEGSSESSQDQKPIIIDPETLPRDEKEALMIENNEMHVHITKLQSQINALTNYKAALESMLTDEQKMALRGEVPQRSLVRQVSGLIYNPISFFRSVVFGKPEDPPPLPPPALLASPRPRSNSTVFSPRPTHPTSGPPSSSTTTTTTTSSTTSVPDPPQASNAKYGAPKPPSAPKGDGSLFSLTNRSTPAKPPTSPRFKFKVKTKDSPSVSFATPLTTSSPPPPPEREYATTAQAREQAADLTTSVPTVPTGETPVPTGNA